MNTALEYSTRVVQEGGRRCKKSTLNDLVHLTTLRIPLMNPPTVAQLAPERNTVHFFCISQILVSFTSPRFLSSEELKTHTKLKLFRFTQK
jgi:hypothetical protein